MTRQPNDAMLTANSGGKDSFVREQWVQDITIGQNDKMSGNDIMFGVWHGIDTQFGQNPDEWAPTVTS